MHFQFRLNTKRRRLRSLFYISVKYCDNSKNHVQGFVSTTFHKNSFYNERNERLRILAAPLEVNRVAVRVVLSVEASHDQQNNSVKHPETVPLLSLL